MKILPFDFEQFTSANINTEEPGYAARATTNCVRHLQLTCQSAREVSSGSVLILCKGEKIIVLSEAQIS